MTPSNTDHPNDIPTDIVEALEGCSDRQLRGVIDYVQQRLREHPSLTDAIESRPGEELVRMEDHGAYTIVIVERPDETGEVRGPFAYRVKWESHIDEEGSHYKWHYLGRVSGEEGGDQDG